MILNMKPLNRIKIEWSPEFAYAIGLLVTDGSLSKDGRHINFSSKDLELIETFKNCLQLKNTIGRKGSGSVKDKRYYQIQFGDVNFYRFLLEIGLSPAKSKIIAAIEVPDEYFFDFLRGHFDGDGSCYSYFDPRWKNSYMFYLTFGSASKKHIDWLRAKIQLLSGVFGHLVGGKSRVCYEIRYAKRESLELIKKIYYKNGLPALGRKHLKIQQYLRKIH